MQRSSAPAPALSVATAYAARDSGGETERGGQKPQKASLMGRKEQLTTPSGVNQ